MNVHVVGRWDGVTLWVQWDEADPSGYKIEVRFKAPGTAEFGPWQRVGGSEPLLAGWIIIPTHSEGSQAQARVARFSTDEWTEAVEARFGAPSCRFAFSSSVRCVHYVPPVQFHSIVDGHPAYYELTEEVELDKGETTEVTMRACDRGGFHQLDYPGHFEMRPSLGLSIRNVCPSENDLEPTGCVYTTLTSEPRTGPIRVVFGRTAHFDGTAAPE